MLIAGLQTIHNPQHLCGIPAGARRVAQDAPNDLLRVDNKHGSNGESNPLLIDIRRILVIDHIIGQRDLAVLVADDGEAQLAAGNLVDVFDPGIVAADGVCREPDELGVALCELGLELGEGAELGRAHGREVFRVREEDDP